MPIRTTTADAANTNLYSSPKARMTTVTLNAVGLLPNSVYTFWVNGMDMSWACRTPGTKQGASLTTDETGSMTVYFSTEIYPDYSGSSGDSTKYHSFQLKDINGNLKSVGVIPQLLNSK